MRLYLTQEPRRSVEYVLTLSVYDILFRLPAAMVTQASILIVLQQISYCIAKSDSSWGFHNCPNYNVREFLSTGFCEIWKMFLQCFTSVSRTLTTRDWICVCVSRRLMICMTKSQNQNCMLKVVVLLTAAWTRLCGRYSTLILPLVAHRMFEIRKNAHRACTQGYVPYVICKTTCVTIIIRPSSVCWLQQHC